MDKTVRKFLISYGLLLIPLLIIMVSSFVFAYVQFRNEIIERRLNELENVENRFQTRLDEIEKIGTILGQQQDILLRSISSDLSYERLGNLTDLQNIISSYEIVNTLIDTIFIYFYDTKLTIFPDNISTRFGLNYGGYFSFEGFSRKEWRELFVLSPGKKGILPERITYVDKEDIAAEKLVVYQKFPILEFGTGKGVIGIVLSADKLSGLFESSEGDLAIFSSEGSQLLSSNPDGFKSGMEPDGDFGAVREEGRSVILYRHLPMWDLHLYSRFSKGDIFWELLPVLRVYVLIMILYVTLGILISLILAKRNAVPFNRLIDENSTLTEKIREYQPILQSFYAHDIIQSGVHEPRDIDKSSEELSLPLENGPCHLLIFDLGHEFKNEASALIIDEMSRIWDKRVLVSYESPGRLIGIVPEESDMREKLEALLDSLGSDPSRGKIRVAASSLTKDFSGISEVYRRTAETLEYYPKDERIYLEREIPRGNRGYRLPEDYERQIIQHLLQGDMEKVGALWDDIYSASFRLGNLGLGEMGEIRKNLEGLLIRLQRRVIYEKELDINRIRGYIDRIIRDRGLSSRYEIELDFFSYICQQINSKKKSRNEKLKKRISAYIDGHYGEWDLGLDALAKETGLTRNYLSNYFKEQFGVTFTSYLTRIRIEEAIGHIKGGASPQQTSARVGYQNYNSFYRAFKRETGRSPTDFQ